MNKTKHQNNKPGKNTNITYNQNLNIDYSKLAEAIVEAECKARAQQKEAHPNHPSFFKALRILWKGEESDGRSLSAPFAMALSFMFKILSLLLILFLIFIWLAAFCNPEMLALWHGKSVWTGILFFSFLVVITLIFGILGTVFHGASKASMIEKDSSYVLSAFSGLVSFVSLVIALIALLR